MPQIPETEINHIKQSVDLVSLCRSRAIKLRKVGKNYKGRCPFHEEDNASFVVNPEKNLWNCFGCDMGGDVIKLVMDLDKLTFPEAVAKLSKTAVKTATKRKRPSFISGSSTCTTAGSGTARSIICISQVRSEAFSTVHLSTQQIKSSSLNPFWTLWL